MPDIPMWLSKENPALMPASFITSCIIDILNAITVPAWFPGIGGSVRFMTALLKQPKDLIRDVTQCTPTRNKQGKLVPEH